MPTAEDMSSSPTRPMDARPAAFARTAAGVLIAILIALHLAPRGAMLYLAVLAACGGGLMLHAGWTWRQARWPGPFARGGLAFGLFAMLSALWSVSPGQSLELGLILCVNVLLTVVAADWLLSTGGETRARLGRGVLIGLTAGLALLAIELLDSQAGYRFVYNLLPWIRPGNDQDYGIVQGQIVRMGAYMLNRQMAVPAVLLWPVLAIAGLVLPAARRLPVQAGIGGAAVVLVLASQHESSKLAILAALPVLGLALLSPVWARRATLALWCALLVLVVPLTLLEFRAKAYEATWIQDSGRARLILWGVAAEKVLEAPVLGIGAGAGAVLDARVTDPVRLPGQPFDLRTGAHQHNVYLQTWYELGAIGALLLGLAGWLAVERVARLPAAVQPFGLATFTAAAVLALTSYGLWQPWFTALFCLAVVLSTLAAGLAGLRLGAIDEGHRFAA